MFVSEYYPVDQIKKNKMNRTRDTYSGDERWTQRYDGDLRETDLLEDVGGDGRVKSREIKNGAWTGLIWLSIGTRGGPLWKQ